MASHPPWELHTPFKHAELVKFYRLYNLGSYLISTAERGRNGEATWAFYPRPLVITSIVLSTKSER